MQLRRFWSTSWLLICGLLTCHAPQSPLLSRVESADVLSPSMALLVDITTARTAVQQMITAAMADGGVQHEEDISAAKHRIETLNLKGRLTPVSRKRAREANERGLKSIRDGQFAQAVEAFQAAQEADPTDIEISNNLGHAYLRHDDVHAAEQWLFQALMLAPGRSSAWADLAQTYAKQGNLTAARACFAHAYRFARNRGTTHRVLEGLTTDANEHVAEAAKQALQLPLIQGHQANAEPEKTQAAISAPDENLPRQGQGQSAEVSTRNQSPNDETPSPGTQPPVSASQRPMNVRPDHKIKFAEFKESLEAWVRPHELLFNPKPFVTWDKNPYAFKDKFVAVLIDQERSRMVEEDVAVFQAGPVSPARFGVTDLMQFYGVNVSHEQYPLIQSGGESKRTLVVGDVVDVVSTTTIGGWEKKIAVVYIRRICSYRAESSGWEEIFGDAKNLTLIDVTCKDSPMQQGER
jgi:tetratricopeptide (TPR) repeat protein